jgi:hypothetical protein
VAFVHPDHEGCAVSLGFVTKFRNDGLFISNRQNVSTAYGDSVAGSCCPIVGVHSNTEQDCTAFELKSPPTLLPQHLGCHLRAPFNWPKMVVSYSMHDPSFNNHAINDSGLPPFLASLLTLAHQASIPLGMDVLYYLHLHTQNPSSVIGAAVINIDHLCPPFIPDKTPNIFGHHFGIIFLHNGQTYVCPITPFEFVLCHCLGDEITYKLSHPSNTFCLDATAPGVTSAWIIDKIHFFCSHIRVQNCKLFEPCQYTAPAACALAFLNNAVGV